MRKKKANKESQQRKPTKKANKECFQATILAVKEEMAKPRMTKSAREKIELLRKGGAQTTGRSTLIYSQA
jgi:hypothetical protein